MLGWTGPAEGQVFYVDNQSGSCSDLGPGTEAQPYCTINAAAAAHKGAGITIIVKPGTYREMVTVPASGASGSPYVFQAQGPGVILDGADDLGQPSQWTLYSGTVWLATGVTWDSKQVFVDGARIDSSGASPAALPPNTFNHILGEGLYVNLGGDNPGDHATLVSHRANGFNMSTKTWITIDGFQVTRTDDRGIRLQTGCSNIVIANNQVTFANSYGIHTIAGVNLTIEGNTVSDCTFHGIGLTAGATGCTVRGNHSFRNARVSTRVANGFYLFDAPGNTLYRNRSHDNEDTGFQIQSGSNDCVLYDNISWNNGDHGFDHLGATGTIHSNDVAYGNFKDGFSIEGGATGTQIHNSISVNNGITTNESDLWVDVGSAAGFVSDYNIFWNSTAQPPINFMTVQYASIADYQAASGQDAHSLQADPGFVNPATGDFHLLSGSPAIDAGNSGAPFWPALDLEGNARVDVPAVPNTGAGPTPFGDLGALEFQVGSNPVAVLTLTPPSGTAPLEVTADASGSSDNGTIVSYTFDFGDGTIVGPQPGASAVHTLAAGTWTVAVTVTDNDGLSGSASQGITVDAPSQLVAELTLTPATGNTPLSVIADASGSNGDRPITSFTFDMGNGALFGPQSEPTAAALYTPGFYTVTVMVQDDLGQIASTTREVIVAETGPGPNLVGNPSFESDASGWSADAASIAVVPGGFDGPTTLRVTASGSGQFGIDDVPNWTNPTGPTGTRYRFRAWVRSANGGGGVRIRVREHNANGQQQGPPRQSSPITLTPTWQLLTFDYVCEAAGNNIDFRILNTPLVAGEVMDLDNIMVNVVTGTSTVDVAEGVPGPLAPTVQPNPVGDHGSLQFAILRPGPLRVELFDVSGRRVRTLLDRSDAPASRFEFALDGRGDDGRRLGPGLYLYRVQAPEGTVTGRFAVVR